MDINEADIEKTKPKNCGMVKEKVKNIESLQTKVMNDILTLAGRVEIMKINQDNDKCVHHRNYKV